MAVPKLGTADYELQMFSRNHRRIEPVLGAQATTKAGTGLSGHGIKACSPEPARRSRGQACPPIPSARSVRERANTFVSDGTQRSGAPVLSLGRLVTLLQTATGSVAECT